MSGAASLKQTDQDMNDIPPAKTSVTIKKYANRRLYNTATSSYVTLESLSAMVKEGIEFNVYDAKTSEDITRSVLTQIIVEEEGKAGQNLLPISFLRQLIGFYGDNMQWVVPKYLEHSMQMLSNNQEQLTNYFQTAFGNMFPFGATLEEMSRQNLAMFENAMKLFAPFAAMDIGQSAVAEAPVAVAPRPAAVEETAVKAAAPAPVAEPVRAEEPVPAPMVAEPKICAVKTIEPEKAAPPPAATPMPNVKSAAASTAPSVDDMQQKIANLQRQLADLAKNRA